jgi:hypothetical protein
VPSLYANLLFRLPNRLASNSHASGFDLLPHQVSHGFQLADLRRLKQHNHHHDAEMTDRGSLCNQVISRLQPPHPRRASSSGALEFDTDKPLLRAMTLKLGSECLFTENHKSLRGGKELQRSLSQGEMHTVNRSEGLCNISLV